MFLSNKIGWVGIAFALLTSGMLAQDFPRRPAGSDCNKGVPESQQNEVKRMQEALHNKGHHRGEVDGVLGLRTRASIRAYQKAENLPITGSIPRRPVNSESGRWVARRPAPRLRGVNLRQA